MRGQVNGQPPMPNVVGAMMLTPQTYEGRARILEITRPGRGKYQISFNIRGWHYIANIKKNRPHYEWVKHHVRHELINYGEKVILAATLHPEEEYTPGVYKLDLWRVAMRESPRRFHDRFSGVNIYIYNHLYY